MNMLERRTELFSQKEVDTIIAKADKLCEKVEKIAIRVLSWVTDSELEFENRLFDLKQILSARLDRIFAPTIDSLNELRESIQPQNRDDVNQIAKISVDICQLEELKQTYYGKVLRAIPELFPESYPEVNKKYKKAA